jgi:pantothenate kinase
MDGFHLYKRELDAMDDPAEAYKRRGAPWTFNPTKFFTLLHAVKAGGAHTAPSFDHKYALNIDKHQCICTID